jgi:hypothetical protein
MRKNLIPVLRLAAFLAVVVVASAQDKTPRIGYVYPAGGQRGATFEVTIAGKNLGDARGARFSGGGIQAAVVGEIPSMDSASGKMGQQIGELMQHEKNAETEMQIDAIKQKLTGMASQTHTERGESVTELRAKLTELMKGEPDAATKKQIAEIQFKLSRHTGVLQRSRTYPLLAELVRLKVTLAPDAEPGPRELRLETPDGLSNPLTFCVGVLPEFREPEPEITVAPRYGRAQASAPPQTETRITLPVVVNGQIIPHEPDASFVVPDRFTPGDADRYRFEARKGQQLVCAVSARQLIPYLADAVPGWFQATLTLYDAKGNELAYTDDYRFHPDPVLFFKVPEDGEYIIEIADALSRGRPDFVYRIAIGELPFITGLFPLGGRAGEQTGVDLSGWNLPAGKLTFDGRDKAQGVYPLSVRNSNLVPFAADNLPECLENEPNDTPPTVPTVTIPTIINGRIGRPGDKDVFAFTGRAGQRLIAEVIARRLNSPLDSALKLTDAAGKRLAFNDDHTDKADGLHTHHADSLIDFTLPADGTYFLHLSGAQNEGGRDYTYRLAIHSPQPDFALRVVPSCINARAGQFVPVTIFALRQDGFDGEIALSLKDAPPGFSLAGGLLPAGQDQVRVTMLVPPNPAADPLRLSLQGRATIGGQPVVRTAVPADDMTQAFAYKHLVPARQLNIAILQDPNARRGGWSKGGGKAKGMGAWQGSSQRAMTMTLLDQQPVKIPVGGTAQVRIGAPGAFGQAQLQIELSEPPDGITVDSVTRAEQGLTIVLKADDQKAKPGLRGNLIASAFSKNTWKTKGGKSQTFRWVLGTLPAIPFEIVTHENIKN